MIMNKNIFKIATFVLVAGLAVLTGCGKDEETKPVPTISFQNGVAEVTVAETTTSYDITATIGAESEISTLTVMKKDASGTEVSVPIATGYAGKTSYALNVSVTGLEAAKFPYTITIKVVDKEGETASKIFTIKKQAGTTGTPFGEFNSYTTVLLGGSTHATLESFYATSTGTKYLLAAAKTNAALVDFCYFYGATNKATLAAPADADAATMFTGTNGVASWSVKNATKFIASTIDFAAIATTTDIAAVSFTSATTKSNNLAVGNVIAFKTAAGKIGFIKVTACTNANDGSITLDVKVQK